MPGVYFWAYGTSGVMIFGVFVRQRRQAKQKISGMRKQTSKFARVYIDY